MRLEDITDIVLLKYSDTSLILTKYTVRLAFYIVQLVPVANPAIAINRLDRLTSGLMIIPLNADLARAFTNEFMNGSVRKEYVARCKGEFPACVPSVDLDMPIRVDRKVSFRAEVVCEEPLLTVDRQMGLNIVHPEGKVRFPQFPISILGNARLAGQNSVQQVAL